MSGYKNLANDLVSALELAQPPIAISVCDAPPPNVPAFNGMVPPSGSWRRRGRLSPRRKIMSFALSASTRTICRSLHRHISPSSVTRLRP